MAGGVSRGSRAPHGAKPPHVRAQAPKVLNNPGASGLGPGLLLELRRCADGWEGRVAYVPHPQNGHELWLPAQLLHEVR